MSVGVILLSAVLGALIIALFVMRVRRRMFLFLTSYLFSIQRPARTPVLYSPLPIIGAGIEFAKDPLGTVRRAHEKVRIFSTNQIVHEFSLVIYLLSAILDSI
jgi:hypothetical protein